MDALGTARLALSSDLALIRSGLAGLDLTDKTLTTRAANFVASGDDPSVLTALAALGGLPFEALGNPGLIGWVYGGRAQSQAGATEAATASLRARASLYQRVTGEPEQVAMLVRLGQVLAAAGQAQHLSRPMDGLPDWLQTLLNDALWNTAPRNIGRSDITPELRPAWTVALLAALLADDSRCAIPVLSIVFERSGIDSYHQDRIYLPLLAPGLLDDYMLAHSAEVAAAGRTLSAVGRIQLLKRLGSHPPLLAAFETLIITMAAGDSKTVRAAAIPLMDSIAQPAALAALAELLAGGRTGERANAADLLARTQGEAARPVLEAALAQEAGKTVQQAIQAALSRLGAATDAGELSLPEPPPLPPPPTEVLGEGALELLRQNRLELLERYHTGAEQEIAANRDRTHPYKFAQEKYARYRKLDDGMLRDAILAANGQSGQGGKGGERARALLTDRDLMATLELNGRLEARADFGLLQVLRLTVDSGFNYWGLWTRPLFQNWLRRQDRSRVDLRQLMSLVGQCGGDVRAFGASLLRPHGGSALLDQLPADRVWPLFAEHPELIDIGLGLAPSNLDRYSHDVGCTLAVLATFPVIPPRWVPTLMELALGDSKTHRAAARQVMARMPDIGKRVVDALQSGKQELRIEAARWLAALDYRAGIPPLQAALDKETRETASAAIMTALEQLGVDIATYLAPEKLLAQARKGLKAKPPASMAWLDLDSLPACTWADGTPVEAEIIRWWVILACKLKEPGGNALLERYLGLLSRPSAAALGTLLLHQFIARDTARPPLEDLNADVDASVDRHYQNYLASIKRYPEAYAGQARLTLEQMRAQLYDQLKREKMSEYLGTAINEKGMLALVACVPGAQLVGAIQQYMRDHYQRRAQVEALLEAACGSNDGAVIQFALGIARRYRTASVQEKARMLVQRIADRNGWTQDELADRTVPTGGLDDSGRMALQYGSRVFTVSLDAALKPVLRNEEGKTVAALPAPRQDDDADAIKEAKQQFAACKKEVKQVVDMQTSRLYEAMCAGRRWPAAEWRQYLLRHPVVGRLVQQLVWEEVAVDGAGLEVTRCFRPTEDGSLIDAGDDDIDLDDAAQVRLAHGALLPAAAAAAWTAHCKDYKLTPLFAQMTHALPTKSDGNTIDDRLGWLSDSFTLRGAFAKRGYQRGAAEDGGVFFDYHKDFAASSLAVVIEFSGNSLPEENITAVLKSLSFRRQGAHRYDYSTVPLAQVPPVLLAEAYGDYLAVAAACTGFDPDWEKKTPW